MLSRSSLIRESEIQKCCIEWLEWHGWSVIRLNSGKLFPEQNGKKRCVKLCEEGTPDTVAFKPSAHGQEGIVQLVFIEFKRLGNKPTMQQYLRMQELELYGAACWVISSVEELEDKIERFF